MFRTIATTAIRRGIVSSTLKLTGLRAFSEAGSAPLSGTVKWFDAKKGFGFLVPDDGSEDVFVHHSVIHAEGFRSLMDGEPVEFEIQEDENGRKSASSVTGPDGTFVQGRPMRTYREFGDSESGNDGFLYPDAPYRSKY